MTITIPMPLPPPTVPFIQIQLVPYQDILSNNAIIEAVLALLDEQVALTAYEWYQKSAALPIFAENGLALTYRVFCDAIVALVHAGFVDRERAHFSSPQKETVSYKRCMAVHPY